MSTCMPDPDGFARRLPTRPEKYRPPINDLVLEKIEIAKDAIAKATAMGLHIHEVNMQGEVTVVRVRHSRYCLQFEAYSAGVVHGDSGRQRIMRSRWQGIELEWREPA